MSEKLYTSLNGKKNYLSESGHILKTKLMALLTQYFPSKNH